MDLELLVNRLSMIFLILAGIFFIYEGAVLIDSHRENPQRIPYKVAVAGSLTVALGIMSIVFAFLHLLFAGGGTDFFKNFNIPKPKKSVNK